MWGCSKEANIKNQNYGQVLCHCGIMCFGFITKKGGFKEWKAKIAISWWENRWVIKSWKLVRLWESLQKPKESHWKHVFKD